MRSLWKVPERASSLNSGDAFVLTSPDTVFVWIGKGCEGFERGPFPEGGTWVRFEPEA